MILGTIGGLGLLVGPAGLLAAKWRRDPVLQDQARFGMDVAFIAMLFIFITMPYGKFVHGIYRFAALTRYAQERRALATSPADAPV